jgi:hypothetical protein
MIARLTSVILLLLAVFLLPWWLWLFLAVGFIFFIDKFYEIIPIFFLSDLVFALPEARFGGVVFVTTLAGIAIYFGLNMFKKRLRS